MIRSGPRWEWLLDSVNETTRVLQVPSSTEERDAGWTDQDLGAIADRLEVFKQVLFSLPDAVPSLPNFDDLGPESASGERLENLAELSYALAEFARAEHAFSSINDSLPELSNLIGNSAGGRDQDADALQVFLEDLSARLESGEFVRQDDVARWFQLLSALGFRRRFDDDGSASTPPMAFGVTEERVLEFHLEGYPGGALGQAIALLDERIVEFLLDDSVREQGT
jgi:hypothetical protein